MNPLVVKGIIILLLLFTLISLGSSLVYLVRGKPGDSDRVVKALTWRIGLSLLVFVLLLVAFAFGWLTPRSL
jgi:membrane-associated protease RseP (regulator of RpoE activity)